jgi:hypothetical protein
MYKIYIIPHCTKKISLPEKINFRSYYFRFDVFMAVKIYTVVSGIDTIWFDSQLLICRCHSLSLSTPTGVQHILPKY